MPRTIIIQRVLPHYRRPLFDRLHAHFGWELVIAANPPTSTFLDLAKDPERNYIHKFDYTFPDPGNAHVAKVPLNHIIAKLKPETVICEFSTGMSTTYQLPRARFSGAIRNYALWSHGWNMGLGFSAVRHRVRQYGRLPLMIPADALLAYTEEGAAWLRKWLPWKTVVPIGNTLDLGQIWREGSAGDPVRHGTPQFLGIGRLLPEKGFDRLLGVFRQVSRHLPEAALTIIGDGPDHNRLKRLAGNDLGGRIHLPGAIYDEAALGAHFLGADAFVLLGAAGLSVNHALAYGLPVVAFPRGAHGPNHHPEIAYVIDGVTGHLCPRYSDEAMAETLVRHIGSRTSDSRRRQIRAYAQRHYSIDSMIDSFAIAADKLNCI